MNLFRNFADSLFRKLAIRVGFELAEPLLVQNLSTLNRGESEGGGGMS